jgi:primosomal protein N'
MSDIFDNSPIIGCRGCQSTAGRIGCPFHGVNITYSEPVSSDRCGYCHKPLVDGKVAYCPDCNKFFLVRS